MAETTGDVSALTSVEYLPGQRVWLKRDDEFAVLGSRGGKVRTCWWLVHSQPTKPAGLVTAGARQSPQANIVATVAAVLGLPCRAHSADANGPLTPELEAARRTGAELVFHRPGYNNVIAARAREDARERGWLEVPFGMETPAAVELTAWQTSNLPLGQVKRVVVPLGSGMSCAGILSGLAAQGRPDIPVVGVLVGAKPFRQLDQHAPGWRERVQLVSSELPYNRHAPTQYGPAHLDPVYEAKCVPFLEPGDLLWVVGRREHLTQ